jgi:Mn-dependent DtxR family transcriptional regulator
VSKATLAPRIDMSEGTAAAVLREMAADGLIVAAGQRGYVLPGGVQ